MPEKVLNFNGGWDTLHPCSQFSYGGVPKKMFLVLLRKSKNGEKLTSDQYLQALYGSLQPSMYEISKKIELSETVKKHFSWKK